MEPIISPWIFYLISVSKSVFIVSMIVFIILLVAIVFVSLYVVIDCGFEGEYTDTAKSFVFWAKKSLYFLIPSLVIVVFTPRPDTIYKMIAASYITPANVSAAVAAGSDVKTVIKQDIIDIIRAVKEESEKK